MLRPRTGAVACLASAAVVTVAVRETPAGVAPGPSDLPPGALPGALIVALNGNDVNRGILARPLATIQKAVNVVPPRGTVAIRGGTYALTRGSDGGGRARRPRYCERSHA